MGTYDSSFFYILFLILNLFGTNAGCSSYYTCFFIYNLGYSIIFALTYFNYYLATGTSALFASEFLSFLLKRIIRGPMVGFSYYLASSGNVGGGDIYCLWVFDSPDFIVSGVASNDFCSWLFALFFLIVKGFFFYYSTTAAAASFFFYSYLFFYSSLFFCSSLFFASSSSSFQTL